MRLTKYPSYSIAFKFAERKLFFKKKSEESESTIECQQFK